jgi:signal transduction histidine kinase/PAS domain-containing protein
MRHQLDGARIAVRKSTAVDVRSRALVQLPSPAPVMFPTERPSGTPDPAAAPEPDSPAASMLLVSGATDPGPLRLLLESAIAGAFDVMVEKDLDAGLERLRKDRFDAVLLDLDGPDGTAPETVAAVRALARGAALIVRIGDPDLVRTPDAEADEWIGTGDSASATAACIRGAVERRRLSHELQWRSAELTESEARFRNIVERTADGIVVVNRAGRVRFANPGAERMFARSAADLVDQDFGVAVVSGETTEMDIVRPSETEPVVAELRVSETIWDGSAAQIISLRDITDRKRADERAQRLRLEQAAREQAEKDAERSRILADAGATLDASLNAETTLASLASLVVPRVADWCVIDLLEDEGIHRVVGIHSDRGKQELLEELGQRFTPNLDSSWPGARVLRTGTADLQRELDADAIRKLAESDEHATLLSRLGTRSSMTVPLEAREQCLGAMIFVCGERDFDETDLALAGEIASRAARALDNARLFEAALDANRVKSDFLAVMSHELRTPLTAILGFTDLLLEGVAGAIDEQQTNYLRRIRAGATQLLTIIQEILTYAQAEAGLEQARPGAILIGDLIDEIATAAEPLVRRKGLDFRVRVEQRNSMLRTDVGKLRQIILTLLTNAAKFTETGAVDLSVEADDGGISITVSDTGIGIAPDQMEGIFEAFRQVEQGTTRRAGGTGIGLSISRQLAGLLGGELSVESVPEHGSTFTLRLPTESTATGKKG